MIWLGDPVNAALLAKWVRDRLRKGFQGKELRIKQRGLFSQQELPLKLKKLTDEQIDRLATRHFGNLDSYYHDDIVRFARAIEKAIQGRNK